HNNLRNLRKLLLIYRLIHFDDLIIDTDTGLNGRDKELCKPLLQLFYDTESYSKIANAISTFLARKNTRKNTVSIEPVLYKFIKEMLSNYKNNTISVKDIWEYTINNLGGVYDPDKKPNEFQSYDYDTIYRSTITKVLEGFGAERKHKETGNVLIFDPKKLERIGKQYEEFLKTEGTESTEGNMGQLPQKVIQNCIPKDSQSDNMPSVPSSLQDPILPYRCPFCEILGHGIVSFSNTDSMDKHTVQRHPRCNPYSQPDIEKFRQEYLRKCNGNGKEGMN
ncbi:MAG: hypothetical protein ACRD8W_32105, partial [Nitrososphaeraceae archaeon]